MANDTNQSPPGYESLPGTLLETLRRSYEQKRADNLNLANAMGWPLGAKTAADITFKEVLDKLRADGLLAVIAAIHNRCVRIPGLWGKITAIRNAWTYTAGNGVSQGMVWTASDPDGAIALARKSDLLCEDLWPMNADHQKDAKGRKCARLTFREIVSSGAEGLHVCIVTPPYRVQDLWGGEHDIHIDKHQIGCKKYKANPNITLQAPDGSCLYYGLLEHAKDAIPYFLKKFGVDLHLEAMVGGFTGLVHSAGGIDKVSAKQVGELFSKLIPAMPGALFEQAGEWLLKVMQEFDGSKKAS